MNVLKQIVSNPIELTLTCTILFALGCSGGSSGRMETVEVRGTVLVDDKPVEGATVVFHPVEEKGTRQAYGTTDSDGGFQLTTYDDGDGAIPGEYVVAITKEAMRGDIDYKNLTPSGESMNADYQKMMIGNKRERATVDTGTIPPQYQDREKSDLRRKVDAAGGNEFTFKLTSQ